MYTEFDDYVLPFPSWGTSDRLIGYTLKVCLRSVAAYIHQSKYKQQYNDMARHGTARHPSSLKNIR